MCKEIDKLSERAEEIAPCTKLKAMSEFGAWHTDGFLAIILSENNIGEDDFKMEVLHMLPFVTGYVAWHLMNADAFGRRCVHVAVSRASAL